MCYYDTDVSVKNLTVISNYNGFITRHYEELKKTKDWMGLRETTKAKIEQIYQTTFLANEVSTVKKSEFRQLLLHCKLR